MAIYMKYGNVEGTVTAKGHEKWIELFSFQFGVGRSISTAVGNTAHREMSKPQITEITLGKLTDLSSVKLYSEALKGQGQECKIDFCKTDNDQLEAYLQLTLTEALVSGYSVSSGGDRPVENISLSFTKIEYKQQEQGPDNKLTNPQTVTYDLTKAVVS